ncbi:dockerin type I domain-containing protein [Paenibacillus sp. N3/727]|uniref:dockerin type I domain-containing protein n=1 Tax=Paenibacillus sp. N3/727 TaxID=2925845 RepID=UPI001F530660|nr:dockerin type I domain-containing protein [Paenibacillus sp. N3/727]UNK17346.1 dockerin type I domain-containing protein [Paenibacillus sp. N3/727]
MKQNTNVRKGDEMMYSLFRKSMLWCLSVLIPISMFLSSSGRAEASNTDTTFGQPVDLGSPIQQISIFDSAYNKVNGNDYMYTTVSGTPAVLNVINLSTYEIVDTLPLKGSAQAWVHKADKNGSVYVGSTSNILYRYDSSSGKIEELGTPIPGEGGIWSMTLDDDGNVYGGTFPGGKIFKYDVTQKQFINFGSAVEGQQYVRSMAYHNGSIYAGTGSTGHLIKMDPTSGAKEEIPLKPIPGVSDYPFVYNLDVAGDYLFAHLSGGSIKQLIIYDLVKKEWLDAAVDGFDGVKVSPELNGKVYFLKSQKLVSFDLTSHEVRDTGISQVMSMKNSGWIGSDIQNMKLASIQFNGIVTLMQPEQGVREELHPIVEGQSAPLHILEKGPDGNLYMSAYPSANGARYNPVTKSREMFTMNQAESMGAYRDKLYIGIYPGAQIHELTPDLPIKPNENPIYKFSIGEEQDRPYVFAAGDDKVFFGTVPLYGKLGGSLVTYEPASVTSVTYSVYRNVVEDQSIVGLAYRDGKVYGSTSIHGGLGVEPTATEAKMFVWDTVTDSKLTEFTPDLATALKKPVMISGLTFGPDGLLWAAADGIIFAVNPETLEIEKEASIYPEAQNYGMWNPIHLRWGQDGLLYTDLYGKITVLDISTMEVVYTGPKTNYMTIGDDGNIYYVEGTRLKMIPVNDSGTEQPGTKPSTDVNGDGKVNLLDLMMVAKHTGSPVSDTISYLDMNGDGMIDVTDVGLIGLSMMEN